MSDAYRFVLALHVPVALVALASFWVAVGTRKGSRPHRGSGGVFLFSMSATAATAAVLCALLLADPLTARPPGAAIAAADTEEYEAIARAIGSSLLEQSLLTGTLLHFGWTALRRRRRRHPVDVVVASAASAAGLLLLAAGLHGVLLAIVGALELRALLRRARPPWAWLVEHLAGFVGAGAIANAALAVNVARLLTDDVGLQFAPGGVVGLVFLVAIARVAWRVRRSYGPHSSNPTPGRPRGVTPRPSQA